MVVGSYRGAPWQDCEYLVGDGRCEWLESGDFEPPNREWEIPYALLKAVMAHLYIAWIHPFDDGNGRTARLMELQILLAAGVPMPATHLLSNHYNATRAEYYRQLDAASASGGDVVPVPALRDPWVRRWSATSDRARVDAAVRRPLGAIHLRELRARDR